MLELQTAENQGALPRHIVPRMVLSWYDMEVPKLNAPPICQCDGRRPFCLRCEKIGHACTGPASTWIRYGYPSKSTDGTHKPTITRHPLPDQTSLLALEVLQRLDDKSYPSGILLKSLCGWLDQLPSRVGHHPALDAASKCLLRAHDRILMRRAVTNEEFQHYTHALVLLQKDIDLLGHRASSATACAATILASVEVCSSVICFQALTHKEAGNREARFETLLADPCWRRSRPGRGSRPQFNHLGI